MNRSSQFAMLLLLCGLCSSGVAFGQGLPDGPGKAEFVHNCLDCHSAGMVLRAKKTPEEWRKNVDDMAARGTDGSKEDIDKVVLYLDKYFAVDKSAPAGTPQSSMTFPDVSRAMRGTTENARLTPHRTEKPGRKSLPLLSAAAKGRRTMDEIRAMIESPALAGL